MAGSGGGPATAGAASAGVANAGGSGGVTTFSNAGHSSASGGMAPSAGSGGAAQPGWPEQPDDPRIEQVPGGTVQLGWAQLDIGQSANYDGGESADACPDPDAMLTPGTVDYRNGSWTLTGSGQGFIHGWDQGNVVYFKQKIAGDFTLTMKVDTFEMTNGNELDGAAQALLNVRQDLGFKTPTHSVIAGAAPNKSMFMARYPSGGDDKWWYWPSSPATWPNNRPLDSWTRLVARGEAISAETSLDGATWQVVEHTDEEKTDWYPFKLPALAGERYVALVCSARNDRFYAPLAELPGKAVSCKDPASAHLRGAARCSFSHVTLTQP